MPRCTSASLCSKLRAPHRFDRRKKPTVDRESEARGEGGVKGGREVVYELGAVVNVQAVHARAGGGGG